MSGDITDQMNLSEQQIEQLKEQYDISDEDLQQAQQAMQGMDLWAQGQQRIVNWLNDVRADVLTNRGSSPQQGGWYDEDQARQRAERMDEAEAIERARRSLWDDLTLPILKYLEQQDRQNPDTDPILAAIQATLVELHDPQRREVLLRAVKPEYRDDIRQLFASYGEVIWGLVDSASGRKTDNYWAFLDWLSTAHGISIEDVVAQIPNTSPDEIPDEYRS